MSAGGGEESAIERLGRKLEEAREEMRRKNDELRLKEQEMSEKDAELAREREGRGKEREEPAAKRRKLEQFGRQVPGLIDCMDEGSKKWEVEVAMLEAKGDVRSDSTLVAGLPIRIGCGPRMTSDGKKVLAAYLDCSELGEINRRFSACIEFTLTLHSTVHSERASACPIFNSALLTCGSPAFVEWSRVIDPAEGFISNGRLTIEARIKVVWYYKNAIVDFSSADTLTDVTLHVGGREFHVCRKHVALYAGFFKSLFYSDFADKSKDRVELPEVNAAEFEDLLRMIHPARTRTTVTNDNIKHLLHLSDFFDVDVVRWECTDYLKDTTDFSLAAKLLLTEQYALPELQDDVLGKMVIRETVKGVIDSLEFKVFSDPLKNFVLQKHYSLS